jgi:D-sedoheptulose 7-phosphate isomerase
MSDPMRGLYPFLSGPDHDLELTVEQALHSTREKTAEAARLREDCLQREAEKLQVAAARLARAFDSGARLYAFGNGGSATDAASLVAAFLAPDPPHRALPAVNLAADVAVITALANDVSIDVVFARQLAAFASAGDVALGLSTSGNSANVIAALDEAHRRDLLTIGFAGGDGGRMAALPYLDFCFVVPSASVHRIQEAQTTLYHALWQFTQEELGVVGSTPRLG